MRIGYLLLLLFLIFPFATARAVEEGVQWKRLYHQLFVWNILEESSLKGLNEDEINHWIQKSMYYSPEPTSSVYYKIINSKMSRDAFHARENLLGDFSVFEENFLQPVKDIKAEARDLGIPEEAREFFKVLVQPNSSYEGVDYFQSKAGQEVLKHMKDYLFVVVPGFGSHTMQEFSYAYLVEAANKHYSRPLRRPREKQGNEVVYEDPKVYYGNVSEVGFDVVHPMGNELGNSMGGNEDIADFLAEWIRSLPEPYKDKKIILLGYSKGSPIAHHLVQQHKDIRNRTRMIITVAGVTQGTSIAQSGLAKIEKILENKNGLDSTSQLSVAGPILLEKLLPLLSNSGKSASLVSEGQLEEWKRFFETKDMKKALDGARSMTPYERVKWNMKHVNKENFSNIAIFNLSVLTNVKDLLLPGPVSPELGPELPTQLMPSIDPDNPTNLDWEKFSIDNLFLYLTSIGGFEESAGGLFDTQVGWMDTKSMAIDFRPLSDSLNEVEIKKLEFELGYKVDAAIPRKEIVKEQSEGLDFIDLGELRGTHWDLAFRQVYKPDEKISKKHYVHTFPRRSFLNALLETLTLYKIMNDEDK